MKWKQAGPGIYVAPADGPVAYSVVHFSPSNVWTGYQVTRRQPRTIGTFATDKLARAACETDAAKIPAND